jgi:hypothetical protein
MTLGREGIRLGPPLSDFHGVLTGVPSRKPDDEAGHVRDR